MFSAVYPRLKGTLGLLFVFALTACGGGGSGGGGSLPAVPGAGPTPQGIVSVNGNSLEVTGTVTGFISGGFQLQGGHGLGYLHIYTSSSTTITGAKPFVGENVDVVGTGTLTSGNITATAVSQILPSPSPSPTAAPVTGGTPVPTATGAPIALPAGVVLQSATISAITSSKLTVNGGRGCGSLYVYTNSSTTYFNGAPQAGQYALFTGTGTRCASITAHTVSLSSTPFTSSTVTGSVAQATSYGFLLNTGSTNVRVALTSSTVVFGATLAVGSNVTVNALGTPDTGYVATQISVAQPATPPPAVATPTPGPISMTHVQNFAYIYGYAGTPTTVSISSVAPWVNWTMTDEAHAAALRAAGIKVQLYVNYWRNYTSDNPNVGYNDLKPGGVHAAAEAADCSGAPVYDPNYGGGYEADPRSTAALGHAQTVLSYRMSQYAGNFDAVYADDTGTIEGQGLSTPCGYVQSSWDQAVNAVHSALGQPLFINALGQQNPVQATDMLQPSNVLGAMCELCYSRNGGPTGDFTQTGSGWVNNENAEIATVSMHKIFWDYGRATGDASQETGIRMYAYASFLLTYDPSYGMFQEALSTPSGFPVFPETAFVPMNPLTTQSSVSGYQGPGGAYLREFANCYYQGAFVNRCAVVVNPNTSSAPVPSTSYSHSVVLSGYGVLDGGTVSFNGPAVTTLGPGSAAILLP